MSVNSHLLPPAYEVRRGGNVFSLSVHRGGRPQTLVTCPFPASRPRSFLAHSGQGVPPPPPSQNRSYLPRPGEQVVLCRGRYASSFMHQGFLVLIKIIVVSRFGTASSEPKKSCLTSSDHKPEHADWPKWALVLLEQSTHLAFTTRVHHTLWYFYLSIVNLYLGWLWLIPLTCNTTRSTKIKIPTV